MAGADDGEALMPFYLHVHFRAKDGCDDDLGALIAEMARASRGEPACQAWDAYRSVENPREFTLIERYTGPEGLDAHKETEHFGRIFPQMGPLIDEVSMGPVTDIVG